ncbi:MAG: pyocin knob domain-containing protein [Ghiorsea sp.]
MPTPTQMPIVRAKDFVPDPLVDKAAINNELDNVINALNAIIGNLGDVRRADGQLKSVLADEAAAAAGIQANNATASAAASLASQQSALAIQAATQALHDVVVIKEALMNPHYVAIDNVSANMAAVLAAAQKAADAAVSAASALASQQSALGSENNAAAEAAAAAASAVAAANSAIQAGVIATQLGNPIPLAEKGVANGVATLDTVGKIPNAQLPTSALSQDIPLAQRGAVNGVATLDAAGDVSHPTAQPVITVTDFNLLKGNFEGYASHLAGGATLNSPSSTNGYLKVRKLSTVESVQELTCQTKGTVYMRDLSGGVWGRWSNFWYAPTVFYGGWVAYAAPYYGVQYMKDNNGVVHLRGLLQNGAGNSDMFLLPAGCRPATRIIALGDNSATISRVDIHCNNIADNGVDGRVSVTGTGFQWISLNNISFKAR